MITQTSVPELPSVNLSGNLYEDGVNLAEVLLEVVDDELPGVGITHTSPLGTHTTQEENHRWDRAVLITALKQLSPANELFLPSPPTARGLYGANVQSTFSEGSQGHYDEEERLVAKDGLVMALRLHTADNQNGAFVKLVNAYPGRTGLAAGDSDIFMPGQDSSEATRRGYETLRRIRSDDLMELAMHGMHDPILTEDTIYAFEQAPGSSVIFKTNSSFGPVSGHEFLPINPPQPRDIVVSDVWVYSNPPRELDEYGEPNPARLFKYWRDAEEACKVLR